MASNKPNREYFAVHCYVKCYPQKIGYAYLTKNGSLAIKADKNLDDTRLGVHLKKGISIQLNKRMQAGDFQCSSVRVYLDNNEKQKIGYVFKIDDVKIFIQAPDAMKTKNLGEFLKIGVYIQKQKVSEYQSFADALDKEPLTHSASLSEPFKTSTYARKPTVKYRP